MSYLKQWFNLKELKKINLQQLGVYYTTTLDNIVEDKRADFETDYNDNVLIAEHDLEENIIDYGKIQYDYTDEWEIDTFVNDLIKDYSKYLVVSTNCTWNNASGYKFCEKKIDTLLRDYDCSQYVVNGSKHGKTLLIKEYSHDVPMGHYTTIIGLTDKEYEKIENWKFNDIMNYANAMKIALL